MSMSDLTAARLQRPGPGRSRILLVAGRTWLESTGSPDEHRAPVRLLDRLWLSSRRGIELDVVCDVGRVLRLLESVSGAWDVGVYDAIVLLPDLGRPALSPRLQRVIDRLAGLTRVIGVTDTALHDPVRPAGSRDVTGWSELRIVPEPGECPAAMVAEAVGTAMLGVLEVAQAPATEPRPTALVEHLQRIAVIASTAFEVGSAAIAVLTAGHARTLAAVGPGLGDQACVRAAAMRPMVVLDTWRDTRLARDVVPRGEVRFFAAHPLELADGSAMGALAISDVEPRSADEFDPEVLHDLAVLASAELQYAGASA
ncbi:hypothetical protein [Amnibacterium soli]